jgi:hypothetical protein
MAMAVTNGKRGAPNRTAFKPSGGSGVPSWPVIARYPAEVWSRLSSENAARSAVADLDTEGCEDQVGLPRSVMLQRCADPPHLLANVVDRSRTSRLRLA